ncbi:MAG: quinone oxidoreductase family protein [Solirubrobacterales bacterium]
MPDPEAGEDAVLVDMVVAALNPVDLRVSEGNVGRDATLPRIVGLEGVGFCDGETVLVSGRGLGLESDGTLVERLAVARSALRPVPSGADLPQAACCGVVGATAVRVAKLAQPAAADRLLVLGAGGAVGQALCQLLRSRVSTVVGQARSPESVAVVEQSGVEPLWVTEPGELGEAVRSLAPTVILDGLGGDWTTAAIEAMPARGRLVLYGAAGDATRTGFEGVSFYRRSLSMRGYSGMTEDPELLTEAVDQALKSVGEGSLTFPIAASLPLERVSEAYALLADPTVRGKILVALTSTEIVERAM